MRGNEQYGKPMLLRRMRKHNNDNNYSSIVNDNVLHNDDNHAKRNHNDNGFRWHYHDDHAHRNYHVFDNDYNRPRRSVRGAIVPIELLAEGLVHL